MIFVLEVKPGYRLGDTENEFSLVLITTYNCYTKIYLITIKPPKKNRPNINDILRATKNLKLD